MFSKLFSLTKSVASIASGSIMKYVIGAGIVFVLGYLSYQHIVISNLKISIGEYIIEKKDIEVKLINAKKTISELSKDIELQNKIINNNKIDYENKIKKVNIVNANIKQKYDNIRIKIENQYKEDKNVSKCENAYRYLNSFIY